MTTAPVKITTGRLAGTEVQLNGKKDTNTAPACEFEPLRRFEHLLHYHLTQGFDRNIQPTHVDSTQKYAIEYLGAIHNATAAQRTDWDFGILVFARIKKFTMHFAGLRPSEGTIDVDVSKSPSFVSVTLDTPYTDPRFPFFHRHPDPPALPHADPVVIRMGDHPNGTHLMRLVNRRNNIFNYLEKFDQELWFSIILSARSRVGGPTHWIHLAHSDWSIHWRFTFNWTSSGNNLVPSVAVRNHVLGSPSSRKSGAPSDSDVSKLLKKLNDIKRVDRTNVMMLAAVKQAMEPANRTDKKPP